MDYLLRNVLVAVTKTQYLNNLFMTFQCNSTVVRVSRKEIMMDGRFPMNGQVTFKIRLKTRECFLGACEPLTKRPVKDHLENFEREINIQQES